MEFSKQFWFETFEYEYYSSNSIGCISTHLALPVQKVSLLLSLSKIGKVFELTPMTSRPIVDNGPPPDQQPN